MGTTLLAGGFACRRLSGTGMHGKGMGRERRRW
jgi:hypothetical protein